MHSLPVDPFVPLIVDALRRSRAVVVSAPPGAGKTTRIPPALIDTGRVILLQPRRVAARSIARRIAEERGWPAGREVGWQVRFDRRFTADTRLLVATEGVLTARLQQDPLLSDFSTVVLDEFHERSVHADLAVALAKQAWLARSDLRIVVMSATLDTAAISAFLSGCPVVDVPGRIHPVAVSYAAGQSVADAALDLLSSTPGDLLCFQPGAREIRDAVDEIGSRVRDTVDVVSLHGGLDAAAQDRALEPSPRGRRRIVVATNIAETSLTVPGVTGVIDSGLQKTARYDATRGIDSLEIERIAQDSADQRGGRAGRLGPGVVRRLWDERDRLRLNREPEIRRVDLAGVVLAAAAWGGDVSTLEWFEAPPRAALETAWRLLERLGALANGRLTPLGREMQRLPLHPRLSRMLIAHRGSRAMARACAVLSERHFLPRHPPSTSCDLLSVVEDWTSVPPWLDRVARELEQVCTGSAADTAPEALARDTDADFRRALLAAYPDRVAQRRDAGSPRVKLASGSGAVIGPQSGVRDGEFLIALDVRAQQAHSAAPSESLIRMASRVERDWLRPTATRRVHRFDSDAGLVRAVEIDCYDSLVLCERAIAPDPSEAVELLASAWRARGPSPADLQLLRRARFAGQVVDLAGAVKKAAGRARLLAEVEVRRGLSPELLQAIDRHAPATLAVPTGRTVPLEYTDDGGVTAAVKLQELFGLRETPRVGPRREPVLLALLAPNGRPVQVTRDLQSFWARTYPEVRRELRGRYPKHPWPEDPWTAQPTARTVRRKPA